MLGLTENEAEVTSNVRSGLSTRAIELPDESVASYFLNVFGRSMRETACECERPREANLAQALQLLNSADIQTIVEDFPCVP